MDAPTAPLGKSVQLRHWLARHLVAMIATAIVLTTLGWKNQHHEAIQVVGIVIEPMSTEFGWPRICVQCEHQVVWDPFVNKWLLANSSPYEVTSWQSLLFDAAIAMVSLVATWFLFSRTQRRCQHWWHLSLASLFAFVMLAAVVCTVLKSESLWGW